MMASESPASVEWERAQQVEISVDLVAAAKQELGFLALVDRTPALKDQQVLERAVDRYERRIFQFKEFVSRGFYVPRSDLGVSPISISFISSQIRQRKPE